MGYRKTVKTTRQHSARLLLLMLGSLQWMGANGCDECRVSTEAELVAAFDDEGCWSVRVDAWDSDSMTASAPPHVRNLLIYGDDLSGLRSIAIAGVSAVSISDVSTLERVELAGVHTVSLGNLDSLAIADISYSGGIRSSADSGSRSELSAYHLPSLLSLAVVAVDDECEASWSLTEIHWGSVVISTDSILSRSSLSVAGARLTPDVLMELGTAMRSVLVRAVDDEFVREYSEWLESEGYQGSLFVESCGSGIDNCETVTVLPSAASTEP